MQFDIDIFDDKSSKQPVKDLVRSKIVPQLRTELSKLGPALIAEHGKTLQHPAGSNPSSGFATPTYLPQSNASTPAPAQPTTTTSTGKVNVNTTTVTADDEFRTTAEELFTTFTDPQRLAAFTRGPPRQFDGAKEGGKFSIFDGNVVGEFVKLEKPDLIVQRWRLAQWPEGHFSTQEIRFDQNNVDNVTVLRVKWDGVPIGQEDVVRRNWEGYYVRSIKQTFGYVSIPLPVEKGKGKRKGKKRAAAKTASRASPSARPAAYISWKNATLTIAALCALGAIGLALFSKAKD